MSRNWGFSVAIQQVCINYPVISSIVPSSEEAALKKTQPLLSRTSEEALEVHRPRSFALKCARITEPGAGELQRRSNQSSLVGTAEFLKEEWWSSRGVKDGLGIGKSVLGRGDGLCTACEESRYGTLGELRASGWGQMLCQRCRCGWRERGCCTGGCWVMKCPVYHAGGCLLYLWLAQGTSIKSEQPTGNHSGMWTAEVQELAQWMT